MRKASVKYSRKISISELAKTGEMTQVGAVVYDQGVTGPVTGPTRPTTLSMSDPSDQVELLNPLRAAQYLGISLPVFRRRVKEGKYPPTRINEKGWRYYSIQALDRFKEEDTDKAKLKPPPPAPSAVFDVDTSTRVFSALNAGKNPADVVAELQVHAYQVRAIYAVWVELRGCMSLSKEQVDRLNLLPIERFPIMDSEDLVKSLEAHANKLKNANCHSCQKRPRAYCRECVDKILKDSGMVEAQGSPVPPIPKAG